MVGFFVFQDRLSNGAYFFCYSAWRIGYIHQVYLFNAEHCLTSKTVYKMQGSYGFCQPCSAKKVNIEYT